MIIGFVQGLPIYQARTAHDPHTGQFTSGLAIHSSRLDFEIKSNGNRHFIDGHLKESAKSWLDIKGKHPSDHKVSISVSTHGNTTHIDRIDVLYSKGKGFGTEALKATIEALKKHGSTSFTAYIEHDNTTSQSLFGKLGFKQVKSKQHGSDWRLDT